MHSLAQKRYAPLAFLAVLLLAVLTACGGTDQQSIPKAPSLEKPIVDQTNTLEAEDINNISKSINNTKRDKNQPQIAVLMVDTLPESKDIESASLEVAREWGVGGKDKKNGVLLYIAQNDHEMRIEVADGVSGDLTDVTAKRIIDDVVAPKFKNGDYAEGIKNGTTSIREVVGGKSVDKVVESQQGDDLPWYKQTPVIIGGAGLIMLIGFINIIRRGGRSRHRRHHGYYYGSSSTGSSGGGSFGGGGGFTGGGASGRW